MRFLSIERVIQEAGLTFKIYAYYDREKVRVMKEKKSIRDLIIK